MDLMLTASVNLQVTSLLRLVYVDSICQCIRDVDDQLWVVILAAEPRRVIRATMERLERVRRVQRVQRIQCAHLASVDVAEERVPLSVLHVVLMLVVVVVAVVMAAVVVLVVVSTSMHSAQSLQMRSGTPQLTNISDQI